MDFTFAIYKHFLSILYESGYSFQTFFDYIGNPKLKSIVLRHDVDQYPQNALQMALMENDLGVNASYYFRVVPESFDENIMKQVAAMGHEIGYHYEDLAIADGDQERAIIHFENQLERFRRFYPVKTICMHGSPLSKHDNRDLWKYYNYRDFGIIGEPYFDVDFSDVFYITDTGRKWNYTGASVRDRVQSGFDISIRSTDHLIQMARERKLPNRIMINVHPQRWFNFGPRWVQEFLLQNLKNVIKSALINFPTIS